MGLKLFRTTGYSTLLLPGETRLAGHPGAVVLWASAWIALACNVAVWRLASGATADWRTTLVSIALMGGASAIFFSLFGWRRTLKPSVTLGLVAAALLACGLWSQQLPVASLWQGPPRSLLPAWASFLRWQVLGLFIVLALVPIVWVWNHSVRRLSGPEQFKSNFVGVLLGAGVAGAGLLLLR